MKPTQSDIDRLARTLRQIFIAAKEERIKKRYKISPRHDQMSYFQKAAEQVWELQADPHDYIQACFQFSGMRDGPFANTLGGPSCASAYRRKLESLNMPVSVPAQAGPERIPEPVQLPCDVDLQMDIDMARSIFRHNSGSVDPHHPVNLEIMRRHNTPLECTATCLLGGFDAETLTNSGECIYRFFTTHPNYIEAARKRGFPIDETLKWIHDQVLLKR